MRMLRSTMTLAVLLAFAGAAAAQTKITVGKTVGG